MCSDKVVTTAILMLCTIGGCAPAKQETMTHGERMIWTTQVVQDVVRYKRTLVTTDQLTTMIGEPDAKVIVGDVPKILERNPQYTSDGIENTLSGVYRAYLWSVSPQSTSEDWRQSQEFLLCELWLYSWNHPYDTCVSGVIPKKVAANSDYFLVQDGKVINSGGIVRPAAN